MNLRTGLKRVNTSLLHLLHTAGNTGIFQYLPDRHNRILSYHSVGGTGFDDISMELFRTHLEWLQNSYELVDLSQVKDEGSKKKIAITFDDGYRSFYEVVYPLIQEYSIPVSVFLIGLAIKAPCELDPERRYMTKEQLNQLAEDPLIKIGSHTMTHANLYQLNTCEDLHLEVNGASDYIESELDVPIDRFSYPYNSWSEEAREVVAERHTYAVRGGGIKEFITEDTDPFLLPRIKGETNLSALKYDVSDSSTRVFAMKRSLFG